MRTLRTCIALAMAIPATALADGSPGRSRAAYSPPPSVFSWSGCYLGGHIGGLFGTTHWSDPLGDFGPFINNQDVDLSSLTYGGQIGCNVQIRSFVVGIEGDASWVSIDEFGLNNIVDRDSILRTQFDWYGSVRGRLGYAFDRWLVYGTGGWAFSKIRTAAELYTDASLSQLVDAREITTRQGWTVGGGFEVALTNNLSLRGEYSYYDFGKHLVVDFGDGDLEFARPNFHVARLAVNYKFGMDRPIQPLK